MVATETNKNAQIVNNYKHLGSQKTQHLRRNILLVNAKRMCFDEFLNKSHVFLIYIKENYN